MKFQSSTFEVVCYVELEKLIKIVRIQFIDAMDESLIQLINILRSRIIKRGELEEIDGYFALRLILQFYKREKKTKLSLMSSSFSMFTYHDPTKKAVSLNFEEFTLFLNETFRNITEMDTCILFRTAWSYGDGEVTFYSFLCAAEEKGYFLRELLMENTAALTLCSNKLEVEQKTDNLIFMENYKASILDKIPKSIRWTMNNVEARSSPESVESAKNLKLMLSECDEERPRNDLKFQGDVTNKLVDCWIHVLQGVVNQRSLFLEASKVEKRENKMHSDNLKSYLFKTFRVFMRNLDTTTFSYKLPEWVILRITKL